MRFLILIIPAMAAVAVPVSGAAHVGHVAEVAGHAHWIGLAAVAGAAVIGAWIAGSKDAGSDEAADTSDHDAPEEQAA